MPSIAFTKPGNVKWIPPLWLSGQILVETFGAGAAGFYVNGHTAKGGGAGGYAASLVTVTGGVPCYAIVGQGGRNSGEAGGPTMWNYGQVAGFGAQGLTGGLASGTVAHNGGSGGAAGTTTSGGGGASGAPSGAGNAGASGNAGGAGGAPLPDGGAGGDGGGPRQWGANGSGPGAGGGGAGSAPVGAPGTPPRPGRGTDGMLRLTWTSSPGTPSAFPVPSVPFFPAGFKPGQSDLNSWLHDPFAGLENRPVARFRQASAAQTLPASGVQQVLKFDTVDEDPLGGWQPSSWSWGPPPGWSGWFQVNVTLATAAPGGGNLIRPGIIAPGWSGTVASGLSGNVPAGAEGSFTVYLSGGQDTVQASGTLVNASSGVATDLTAGHQSAMDITFLAL